MADESKILIIDDEEVVLDSCTDILAGQTENLQTVFLGMYKCDLCRFLGGSKPNFIFKNLYQFATYLEDKKK